MASRDKTRGIETLSDEASQLSGAETSFVIAEAAKGLWIHNEIPGGSTTGTDGTDGNATFTLANAPTATTAIWLYKNGSLMLYGANNDYTISSVTITFNSGAIPLAGDKLLCTYRK